VASCAFLAAYNNVIGAQSWHRRWYAPVNACAAAAALAAAGASGLTAGEIGLGRGASQPGRLASALAAATVGGYLAAAAIPVTRPLLDDKRVTTLDGPRLAYQVAFRIPVGTVLWEEIAFRGVLQAALRRVLSEPAAPPRAARCSPGCGPARAAWPRPCCCTWPPTASAPWSPGRPPARRWLRARIAADHKIVCEDLPRGRAGRAGTGR